jgi:hypothetical protein
MGAPASPVPVLIGVTEPEAVLMRNGESPLVTYTVLLLPEIAIACVPRPSRNDFPALFVTIEMAVSRIVPTE